MTLVRDLRLGDRFLWTGRPVEVTGFDRPSRTARLGRKVLVIDWDGRRHALHYYDDETVEVLP